MKKVVIVGGGKKSLIKDLLKKNNETNKHDIEKVSTPPNKKRTNKILTVTEKLIETDAKTFLDES